MTNAEVVKIWVNNMTNKSNEYARASNLHFDGNALISYQTPIAVYEGGKFKLLNRKFSVTTSKHQSLVKYFVKNVELVDKLQISLKYPYAWSGIRYCFQPSEF